MKLNVQIMSGPVREMRNTYRMVSKSGKRRRESGEPEQQGQQNWQEPPKKTMTTRYQARK